MPVPNPPQGKGMTFSFSHAPSLIQQERESCICFPGASPMLSVSHLSDAGAARGSGCVLDQPPTRSRAAPGLFNPMLSATAGDGPFDGGGPGRARPSRTPSTLHIPWLQSTEPAALMPSRSPWREGGHHGVSNGCCITFPDASSLFSPNRTKLSSKRRFLSHSWPKIKVQTKLNGARSLIWQEKFPLQFWSLFTALKVGQTGLRWRNLFGKWSLQGKASKWQTTALQCFYGDPFPAIKVIQFYHTRWKSCNLKLWLFIQIT